MTAKEELKLYIRQLKENLDSLATPKTLKAIMEEGLKELNDGQFDCAKMNIRIGHPD